jgi:hypothetical protein
MSDQINWDFSGDDDAKAQIGAGVMFLLKDAAGGARGDIVRAIIDFVRDVAGGLKPLDACAVQQPASNRIIYKAYFIDAFQRDTDRWRATIRRIDGKKIRVAVPPSMLDETTTSADALTAEKAVGFAKNEIDCGRLN